MESVPVTRERTEVLVNDFVRSVYKRLDLVERLDLVLFIDAKHHRFFGEIQGEADDISHFFDEQRI